MQLKIINYIAKTIYKKLKFYSKTNQLLLKNFIKLC